MEKVMENTRKFDIITKTKELNLQVISAGAYESVRLSGNQEMLVGILIGGNDYER